MKRKQSGELYEKVSSKCGLFDIQVHQVHTTEE